MGLQQNNVYPTARKQHILNHKALRATSPDFEFWVQAETFRRQLKKSFKFTDTTE